MILFANMSIFIHYIFIMNTWITHSSEITVDNTQQETRHGSLSKKAANDLSGTLSGHASPLGTKTPAELKKMKAPYSFSKQKNMEEMLKKYEGNPDYIIIYGYYQSFPKYAFKKPFVDERELRITTAQQQEELNNDNSVKTETSKHVRYANIDTNSLYYIIDRGRRVPRKPNLDQLDGTRN